MIPYYKLFIKTPIARNSAVAVVHQKRSTTYAQEEYWGNKPACFFNNYLCIIKPFVSMGCATLQDGN